VHALILDNDAEAVGIDIALRGHAAGHAVRYWTPPKSGRWGEGMLSIVEDWEEHMDWADLIILTGNSKYEERLAPYFGKGYPIFGTNSRAAELELDRAAGQRILKEHGIDILPFHTVDSINDALAYIRRNRKAFAIKPWGGTSDKAMTCVARDADEAIFMLERWKAQGLKGQLMLQEKVDGVEIGVSAFFGPGGWSKYIEESFEHKRFLNDDLGCNTGEMGTVIRHVTKSKLFDEILNPLTDYLHECNYVGDCSVNCIVDEEGNPWPLEFTMRLGWPDFCIRQAVVVGDPLEWMLDLVRGRDTFDAYEDVAVGVLITHGDFPTGKDPKEKWDGFPISGVTKKNLQNIHFQMVREGAYPTTEGQKTGILTAGNYLMVVTGTGETVQQAQDRAYDIAWKIKMPSNIMFRTDIGDRLEKDLLKLRRLGYAKGMVF
jgi:phosphoribosylamine---glycine ligase